MSWYYTKGLVTKYGEGGATKRERVGGQVKFYPYKTGGGGGEKALAILKAGHTKFSGNFYAAA